MSVYRTPLRILSLLVACSTPLGAIAQASCVSRTDARAEAFGCTITGTASCEQPAQKDTKRKTPRRGKKSSTTKTVSKDKQTERRYRLPRFYSKLNLDEEQTTTVRKIQAKLNPKIDELQEELTALRVARDKEIHDVLTRSQRATLKKLTTPPE